MNTILCLLKKLIIFNLLILNIKYFEIDIPPYTSTGVSAGIEAFKPRYTEVEHWIKHAQIGGGKKVSLLLEHPRMSRLCEKYD